MKQMKKLFLSLLAVLLVSVMLVGVALAAGEETPYVEDPVTVGGATRTVATESIIQFIARTSLNNMPANADYDEYAKRVGLMLWDTGTITEAEATVENCTNVVTECAWNGTRFEFVIDVPAKELYRNYDLRFYYIDLNGDYVYGNFYTVKGPREFLYGNNALGSADAETKALAVAILNYGAAAQIRFSGTAADSPDLANNELTVEQKAMNWSESLVLPKADWNALVSAEKEGIFTRDSNYVKNRAGTLSLEGTIEAVFRYGVADRSTVAKAEFLYWDQAAFDAAEVLTEETATLVEMSWNDAAVRYEYVFDQIPAKDMFDIIYGCAKFTDTEGNVHYGGVMPYCAERFVATQLDGSGSTQETVCKWIAIYGDAARTRFGD